MCILLVLFFWKILNNTESLYLSHLDSHFLKGGTRVLALCSVLVLCILSPPLVYIQTLKFLSQRKTDFEHG